MQHDLEITSSDANTGTSMRSAINAALQALGGLQSGNIEPTTTYACMFWADTSAEQLKMRDTSDASWIVIGTLDTPQFGITGGDGTGGGHVIMEDGSPLTSRDYLNFVNGVIATDNNPNTNINIDYGDATSAVGTSGNAGTAVKIARADHIHSHPNTGSFLPDSHHAKTHTDTDHSGPNKVGVKDEGALTATRAYLNFIGGGVAVTDDGTNANVTIAGLSGIPFVNVKTDFSAVGDGITDDSTPIQSAINSLTTGLVIFPPTPGASYLHNSTITGKSGVHLIGIGYPTLKQGAANINGFDLTDKINIVVQGIKFDGQGLGDSTGDITANRGVFSKDTTSQFKNVTVQDCIFTNLYAFGATFSGPGAGNYSYDVKILNNTFYDMPDEGSNFYYIKRAKSIGNVYRNHAHEAIKMSNSYDVEVAFNQIHESGIATAQGPMINIGDNMDTVRCIGNHCELGYTGIGIEKGGTNIKVIGNTLKGQGNKGISVTISAAEDCDDILIESNTVDADTAAAGIKAEGLYTKKLGRIIVKNNTVKGNVTNGNVSYNMQYIENLEFVGNKSIDSKNDGVSIGKVDHLLFECNTIKNARLHGIDAVNIKYVKINSNTIIDCSLIGASTYHGMSLGTNDLWTLSTAYSLGESIIPTATKQNGYFYECTVAGTTASSEPTWGTTVDGTTTDGGVTWTCREMILRCKDNDIIDSASNILYGIASYATINYFGGNYVKKGSSGTTIRFINFYPDYPRSSADIIKSTIMWTGAFEAGIISKSTTPYTASSSDYTILVDASGGNRIINLPSSASSTIGRIYTIKKIDSSANTVTIDGSGSETIDGSTTKVLSAQWKYITIQSAGNGTWAIIANN